MRRAWLAPLATLLAAALGCTPSSPTATAKAGRAIAERLAQGNPYPVNASPDARRLLVKSMNPSDFELQVIDAASGRVVARTRSPDTQLAPSWRSDGRELAWLSDRDGDQRYRVHFFDVASGRERAADSPATTVTAMRWAPAGTRVAYLVGERGVGTRRLVALDGGDGRWRELLAGISSRAGFTWSPRGDALATVLAAAPDSIAIVDANGGAPRLLPVTSDAEVRAVSWSPDGKRLLATARRAGEEAFGLWLVDLADATSRLVGAAPGDISGPLWSGDGFVYHVEHEGDVDVIACDRAARCRRLRAPPGRSAVTGISADGSRALVLHSGRTTAPALLALPLDGGAGTTLFQARQPERAAVPELVRISSHGVTLPSWLWRGARVAGQAPAAIVRVHGGPDAEAVPTFDPALQLAVERGFDVLSVNYRGSTGWGAAFEHSGGDRARVDDLRAACAFVTTTLGVPRDRVVLFGHSYGAALVDRFAVEDADGPELIVSLSLTRAAFPSLPAARHRRLLAFQGAHDIAVSPAAARRSLEALFGADAAARVIVLPSEGHTFHRLDDWGRIWAELFAAVRP